MRQHAVHVNGIDLCLRAVGDPRAPLVLFLHGFPEYSAAWDEVLAHLADRFHAVAPDQRGYARSGKPRDLEAYRIKHLVRDILGLAEELSPGRPFSIVANDWGASVAHATAIAAPRRVRSLVVLNGVHPAPFQRALLEDQAQRAASAYMHDLRQPTAEAELSVNGFEKLLAMLRRFGAEAWLTPARAAGYLEAWSAPGALTGMLNWYRATPLLVPKPGEAVDRRALPKLDPATLRVAHAAFVDLGYAGYRAAAGVLGEPSGLLRQPPRARGCRRRPLARAPEDRRGEPADRCIFAGLTPARVARSCASHPAPANMARAQMNARTASGQR
jgi:pimeloyl-ACP methyl ester carboxylesterase